MTYDSVCGMFVLTCSSGAEHKSDLLKEHTGNARNSQSQTSRSK